MRRVGDRSSSSNSSRTMILGQGLVVGSRLDKVVDPMSCGGTVDKDVVRLSLRRMR